VSVRVYVEGGGDNKDTLKRCEEGFANYCQKVAPANRRPGVVPVAAGKRLSTDSRPQSSPARLAMCAHC